MILTSYPLHKHSLRPKLSILCQKQSSQSRMQSKLSFHSPHPCKSLSLFSVRRARFSVSAATTQLHDLAPATGTMYDLLGVGEQAGLEEIKAAYRKQARQWHPDVCMSTDDKSLFTQRFMMVREAYEVLSDPELRRGYDSVLFRGRSCSCQDRGRRLRDWEAQLQGLQNRSGKESWGSRMRRAQHHGQSN